jgi:hypothetical protein
MVKWSKGASTAYWVCVELLMLGAVLSGFYAIVHQAAATTTVDVPTVPGDAPFPGEVDAAADTREVQRQAVALDVQALINASTEARNAGIAAMTMYALAFIMGSIVARAARIPFP